MKLYYGAVISSLLLCSALKASLVAINDSTSVNKFLGAAIPACSASSHDCNKGDVTTSTMYVDQRQTIDGLLGINFTQHPDRVFYIFNEFGYWDAQRYAYLNSLSSSSVYTKQSSNDLGLAEQDSIGMLSAQVQAKYPGPGVYIIAISAVPAFVDRIGKNVPVQQGQIKIAALLLYDDGNGFQPLSASCIAVRPTDRFSLHVSAENSGAGSLPKGATAFSGVLTTSSSGSVNFQAKKITVGNPPAAPDNSSSDTSSSSAKKKSTSDTSNDSSSADLIPVISFGAPLNLGASPQSVTLQKM